MRQELLRQKLDGKSSLQSRRSAKFPDILKPEKMPESMQKIDIKKLPTRVESEIKRMLDEVNVENIVLAECECKEKNVWIVGAEIPIILFSSQLLKEINEQKFLGIVAHEIGHLAAPNKSKMEDILGITMSTYLHAMIIARGTLMEKIKAAKNMLLLSLEAIKQTKKLLKEWRKEEYEADLFAAKMGHGKGLIEALKKEWSELGLLKKALQLIFNGTHPPPPKRIKRIMNFLKEHEEVDA
ncbi:MAG: M48 family metalloprotease [Candidatus Micrarchaeota archaeon]|nr:M48 family metalloprotease [Candidatus Micrarchaeota archaeon]